MQFLLAISRLIDQVNLRIGRWVSWTILAAVVVSSANALSRKFLNSGSNAWLELQGYLFGALFLLSCGYTLLKNGHVRVDVLSSRFSQRTRVWVEILGTTLFLLPGAGLIMFLAWPMFWDAWITHEASPNAGGLIRWPAKLLVPLGFTLLVAAGVSHLIKCVGFLRGRCPDPTQRESAVTDEERLADELKLRLDAEAQPRKE